MTKNSRRLVAAIGLVASAALGALQPASALNIQLRPDASFTQSPNGAAALLGFQKAANYWNQVLTSNTALIFDVHFDALAANVLGGTYSNTVDTRVTQTYAAMATHATSALDRTAVANLAPLTRAGGLGFRAPGTDPTTGLLTATTAGSVFDNNNTYNNRYLNSNTAIDRTLGISFAQNDTLFSYLDTQGYSFGADADADITFSSTFGFDYDPSDGIAVGQYDFVGVATHEMGHALGFVSGTDDYDYYIGKYTAAQIDQTSVVTNMDLFRYGAANPIAPDDRYLQLDPNREAFFSVDGSLPFNFLRNDVNDSFFATGATNGDKQQASHWKDTLAITLANGCQLSQRPAGIMDPTIAACSTVAVTSNDLAVMDAIGYDLNEDITADRGYREDTSAIFRRAGLAAVLPLPEPGTWGMMVAGFGLTGAAMRRARTRTAVRFA